MRIREAAKATALTVKAIRHYENVGLLTRVGRVGTYREFTSADVERLRTIAHCRELGFPVSQVKGILAQVDAALPECPSADDMSAVVQGRLETVRDRIRTLRDQEARLEGVLEVLRTKRGR